MSSEGKVWDVLAVQWNSRFPDAKKKLNGDQLNAVYDRAKVVRADGV